MLRHRIQVLFFAFSFCGLLSAQDLHYTYFQMAPLILNPAQTGAFEGTFRIGGIYRSQWSSATGSFSSAFQSPSLYIDAPIIRGFGKNDWLGVGLSFYRDQSGQRRFRESAGLLSVAYHLGLGKDAKNVLSIGGQFGSASRKTNAFEDSDFRDGQLIGFTAEDKNERSGSHTTWNSGIQFSASPNNLTNFRIGVGVLHLTGADVSLGQGNEDQELTINGHAQFTRVLTDRLRVMPALFYQRSGEASRIAVQAMLGSLINPEKAVVLNYGLGFQASNAADAELLLGIEMRDLKVGLSYDVNLSGLTEATDTFGGFELAVSYIAKIYKRPAAKPVIFCPRF